MSMMPPEFIPADGKIWAVRRAWPGGEGRVALEAATARGEIRAGWADASGATLLPPGEDPGLPSLAALTARGTLVSHRPARRAVVRVEGSYVKVVRPGKTASILDALARAQAFEGPFRTPAVGARDADSVTFEALAGRGMHDARAFDDDEWALAWEEVLTAWNTASAAAPGGVDRTHTGRDEAGVLRGWFDRARPLMAGDAEGFGAAVERVAAGLEAPSPASLAPAHRDLHDKQLLWEAGAGPAILDVDTACLAPPALDLGNLRAHALWRTRQGLWSGERAAVVVDAVNAAARRAGVPGDDLALYERAALLRLGCVYAFRPPWAHEAAGLRGEMAAH